MLMAPGGMGKSSWGARWTNPIFIQTEDGLGDIDTEAFPICKRCSDVGTALVTLSGGGHNYKTVVIDTIDWLEHLCEKELCERHEKKSMADFNYGKGSVLLGEWMQSFLKQFDRVRDAGMHVLLLAHTDIKRFNDPGGESYDRYVPKLTKASSELVFEWCDEVLFADTKTFTQKEDVGFNKTRTFATGVGDRILNTTTQATHRAKNRLNLPPTMDFDFASYAEYLGPADQEWAKNLPEPPWIHGDAQDVEALIAKAQGEEPDTSM